MVGTDHEQVVLAKAGQQLWELAVEVGDGLGVANGVVAVAVDHVGVHQVGEAQAVEVARGALDGLVDALGVAGGEDVVGHAAVGEDVVDLAHGQHVVAVLLELVEHGGAGRLEREVVAARGALEVARVGAHVGARDDAGHAVVAGEDLAGDAAVLVELLHGHEVLVGGDLEHAVGRGVDDEVAGLELLLAIVLDDLGARVGLVAKHAAPGLALELLDDLGWKAVGVGGEALGRDDARHLPVAHGGVLAGRLLAQAGEGALRVRDGGEVDVIGALERAVDVEQAEARQVGDVEVPARGAGAQGVAWLVVEVRPVRLGADAEAVEHDEEDPSVGSRGLTHVEPLLPGAYVSASAGWPGFRNAAA